MNSKNLSRQLIRLAGELKAASVWNGSGLAVDATEDSYLYELLCFFHIALEAANKFDVFVDGRLGTSSNGMLVARWPKKPGLKQNFSYLRLESRGAPKTCFQLCPGIKIMDLHGKLRAPDINLLQGDTSSSPTHENLVLCWDAKYTNRAVTRLPDEAVSDFIFTIWQLGSPSGDNRWIDNVSKPECKSSGLVTNALPSTEPEQTLRAYGIAETHSFPDSPITRPR